MTSDPHLTWDEILPLVAVHHELLNDEEISDFCSLLLLSDRVLIAGDAENMAPARLFTACLTELGFTADIADCMATSEVTPHDALVVFDLTGSESLWRLVEPALNARPILLAVTSGTFTSAVAKQADVAVTLPIWPSPSWRGQHVYTTGLQLMSFLIVDVIRVNLLQRTRCNA